MSQENNIIIDDMGKWLILPNGGKDLIEPSSEWFDESNRPVSIYPEPSQEEMDKALRQLEILDTLMEVGLL